MKNNLKKITISLMAVAILGSAGIPISADAKSEHFTITGVNNNQELKEAKSAYKDAVKKADKDYRDDKKEAREKLRTDLKSAGRDFDKRILAYRTYMAEILSALKAKSSAKEAALQSYIDALSNINETNQSPTANAQSIDVTKNTAKTITLTGTDPESSVLTYVVVANPAHGTLSGTAPNVSYTPTTDYTGSDSFTFKVNDGNSDSNTATVSITVNP